MKDGYLARFGENIAGVAILDGKISGRQVWRWQQSLQAKLLHGRERLAKEYESRDEIPQPVEWLLDNWYLAQREGTDGGEAFQRAGRLRAVRSHPKRPLVLELARAFLQGSEYTVTPEGMAQFLSGTQQVRSWTEQELALLVPALKIALLEQVVKILPQVEQREKGEERSKALERIFSCFRFLTAANLAPILEQASQVEMCLSQDPAEVYTKMDEETRRRYRQQVCRLAKRLGMTEAEAAQKALDLAREGRGRSKHVGFYLFSQPLGRKERRNRGALYLTLLVLLPLWGSLFLSFSLHSAVVAFLLLLPLSDLVKNTVDFLALHLIRPRVVHRLALEGGIPQEGKTICVIAALLTGEESGRELAALLEEYRLANRSCGEKLQFGILADLPDGDHPMGSAERAWLAAAQRAVRQCNERYGGGFYLFFRTPVFQLPDERYMGWERKRGALVELTRLLMGRRTNLKVVEGAKGGLKGTRYVITLDSDTRLNVGAAQELVGAMLHPLNRPEIDPKRRVVTAGYGLLQPRVGVSLEAANRSQFSRIFAGQGGVDPYGSTASDLYHDLFDQGTYTGKGIFDVEAFFTCLDGRLPQNQVLSHDLLEGSYLRAGLLGDLELTDSYPYKVSSYFARLHRWVRGDWQLLPWLGRRVRDERGRDYQNPLGTIARWKIFDNLRRSLSPVCTLLALLLGMCLSGPAFAAAATAAILSAWSNLLLSGAELAFRGGRGLKERYHATIIAGLSGMILQTLLQLLLLPIQAWTCASAISTALWRQGVSHRGMLAWVTAADAERKAGDGIWANYRKLWPAAGIGLAAIVWSIYPAGSAVGLLWALSPAFAWALSRPIDSHSRILEADRAFLLHQGNLIWEYFAQYLRREDHWLPPDNWQEQPNPTLARRTSPTNIGMALLSVMAAVDLDSLSQERAVFLLERMLTTLESLPKWHGHLYNWYDTATACPLYPRYVSTVDSGNLCGSLIALAEGLEQWGEGALAARAHKLADEVELSALFDRERKLFWIGYDLEREEFTQGWYDLMASEARQTSYIAVARGEVTAKHWRRLSRALVEEGNYYGMASWTGTMFEYLMPHLLLPLCPNSLLWESMAFCVSVQKKRGSRTKTPWGISESAFYAFDGAMNYQYKAHGAQKLALKRGMDQELVVAPYASFLALMVAPVSAGRNLRRLRALGLEGRFGLYEAADFTPTRVAGEGSFEPVRCFMAHHLGMSLLAIDNALRDNIMQKRFLSHPAMDAFRELLEEKVPVGVRPIKMPGGPGPERPTKLSPVGILRAGQWREEKGPPPCHLLSNGAYTVFCDARGRSQSKMGSTTLTHSDGMYFGLTTGSRACFPAFEDYYFGEQVRWSGRGLGLGLVQTVRVPERENGEIRTISLTNEGESLWEGELVCFWEPVLAEERDYSAHPAFSKLFLESAFTGDGLVFARRPRSRREGTPALAFLWDAPQAGFDTSREAALGRGGVRALEQAAAGSTQSTAGPVLDPCVLVKIPLTLQPGEKKQFHFALAASDSRQGAVQSGATLLEQRDEEGDRRLERLAASYHLDRTWSSRAFALLDRLFYGKKPERPWLLWPYGISGDLPVAVARGEEEAAKWMGCHQLLSRSGYLFDLVFFTEEGGDYRRPVSGRLMEQMKRLGCEHLLGAKGGIHLLERAPQVLEEAAVRLDTPLVPLPPWREERSAPVKWEQGIPLWERGHTGTFIFHTGAKLPPVGWSQILCNGRLGWRTDETGNGHLWIGNAREHALIPWKNDPLAVGGTERFSLKMGGEEHSLFVDGDGLPCTVTYGPGFARWKKEWAGKLVTTTVFVPLEGAERLILIHSEGSGVVSHWIKDSPEEEFSLEGTLILKTEIGAQRELITNRLLEGEAWGGKQLNQTVMAWNRMVSALKVHTPDRELDEYLNGWALYQVIACRLLGRTSLYQNGGAFGFRDQLQDVCALVPNNPDLAREHILKACGRQYREGDVLHWWHELEDGAIKGVRTRISDDLLWLPYTVWEYVEGTGDEGILKEEIPYLSSPPLEEGEQERYEEPGLSGDRGSVLEHAIRAVDLVLERGSGAHGLALMGAGDWNDGMNLVGAEGRGESVWLTWFLALVLDRMAGLLGEAQGARYRKAAQEYGRAADACWDGQWYLRGFYDDGSTLGSSRDTACQLDSIAQSFAVLSGYADRQRACQAVASAVERLYHREEKVIQLFDPPFDLGEQEPGYISGYLPGVRENGGQYTHGAVWLAMACFRLGQAELGYELMAALLPAHHDPQIYRAEPYVLAADVYNSPNHKGRGGWSWYTGAAGWYYRVATQELLGLRIRRGKLYLEPNLPQDWPGYTAQWRNEQLTLHICVERTGTPSQTLDGVSAEGGIPIQGQRGEHILRFTF